MSKKLNKTEKNIFKVGAIAVSVIGLAGLFNNKETVSETPKPSSPAVVAVTPEAPKLPDYCYSEFQRLTLDTYRECIHVGMTYTEVANIIGEKGNIMAEASRSKTVNWGGTGGDFMSNDGMMAATFIDNKMVSKAQTNLYPDSKRK